MTIARPRAVRLFAVSMTALVVFAVQGCDSTSRLSDTELLARATALHAKGDDKAAIVEIRNALQKNPKNADARILLAEIYIKAGNGRLAQNELEIALQRGANPIRTKLPMARADLLQGDFNGAVTNSAVVLATPAAERAAMMEVEASARLGMRQFGRACDLFDKSRAADPQLIEAYWGSATCAAVDGKPDRAREIIGDAIRMKPGDAKSWVLLGDVDRVDRRFDDAEKSYTKALQLNQGNLDALLGRALVYTQTKRLAEAEADVTRIDGLYKGYPLASYITGVIRFRQHRLEEAKTAFETTLTTAPTHFPSILWLGLTNFMQGNYEVASTQLNQYVTLVPADTKVRALLALSRARLGGVKQANIDLGELGKMNIDDPETLAMIGETHSYLGNPGVGAEYLAKAVEMTPDAVQVRTNLAASLLDKNDVPGAIVQLQAALKQKPDYAAAMGLMVRALIQKKDYPAAMTQARAAEALDPKDPAAQDYIGSIQLLQGDKAGGEATFKSLLVANPKFFPASNNLALLAINRGDLNAARGFYEQALVADPRSLSAMLGLHNVERSQGHAAAAQKVLERAVQAFPTEVLPAQLLGQTYLTAGTPRRALDVTMEAFRVHPSDAGLLETRGLAYLAVDEPASALIAFNRLVQIRGDSAAAYLYLASAQTAVGDRTGAHVSLAAAIRIAPANPRVRLAQGVAALGDGHADEALALARLLQKEQPAESAGYVLEASALSASQKPRDALKALQAAVRKFPRSAEVRVSLARALSAAGDDAGLIANLVDWHAVDPGNPLAAEALGEAYLRKGNEAAALEAYRAQLALTPNDVRALNNAAFLSRKVAPQQAVELADRAIRLDPKNADALDTLGQIQTERNDLAAAEKAFSRANELAPANARIRYHFAVSLAKTGQSALARRELERLLAASPSFDGASEARTLLSQLPRS